MGPCRWISACGGLCLICSSTPRFALRWSIPSVTFLPPELRLEPQLLLCPIAPISAVVCFSLLRRVLETCLFLSPALFNLSLPSLRLSFLPSSSLGKLEGICERQPISLPPRRFCPAEPNKLGHAAICSPSWLGWCAGM